MRRSSRRPGANLWWEDEDGTLANAPADGRLLPGVLRAAQLADERLRTRVAPAPEPWLPCRGARCC